MVTTAIYIDSLSRGGAERVTIYIAKYFAEHFDKCTIVTAITGSTEYDVPENVKRISLDTPARDYFRHIHLLHQALVDIKPDVLLIMGISGCATAIPARRGMKIKTIVSERNSPAHFAGKKITKILSQHYLKKADGFVFQTEGAKKYYDRMLHGQGVVIPNPLVSDNLPEPYTGIRRKEIVAVGRLEKQKNHKLLIDAFAEIANYFPDYTMKIYGNGALREELESLIRSYGLDSRVALPGNIKNVLDEIKDAALFVMPSDFEGMPNALIEAMAIGLPCISTDCPCGGPRSLISNGTNGQLVPVGDRTALTNAIRNLLRHPETAGLMGANAVDIRSKLDADKICGVWSKYISDLFFN